MSEQARCERCGGPMPQADILGGACPRCMMELGAESAAGVSKDAEKTVAWPPSTISKEPSRPGTIGRYRVLRLIGEGGMGAVYEAEQDLPRRIVALKIIKPGMASPALLRRFEQESQALGRLQHPGIAQIYEAGTADTGLGPQPYFAMEFIRGKTVTDYAEANHLDARQRLEMVAKISEAVQHAHQRGLIHRDLKPGNILVDESGQPKILDFGVARAIDSDTQATTQTDMGQLVGTLAYMSPEQAVADPLEIDTRTDVYALGVILYELLAGRLPYTSSKLHEMIHAIREEDPAPLSVVSRSYRGDIETIVAKALEKDKARRYGSAAELAADIHRYLKDEPIVARPPSASYQLQKFARRHKAMVTSVAAVFVVLVGGVVTSTWQAQLYRREKDKAVQAEAKTAAELERSAILERAATVARDQALSAQQQAMIAGEEARQGRDKAVAEQQRADTEAATAKAVIEFLGNDLWAMVDPRAQAQSATAPDPNLTVRKALDQAVPRIAGKFENQPLVEATLRETISRAYGSLTVMDPAQAQLELAVKLRSLHQGEDHPDTLASMLELAKLYDFRGQFQNAQSVLRKVVLGARRTLGEENPTTQRAVSRLVNMRGPLLEKEVFLNDEVIKYERRTLGDDHPITLSHIRQLIGLYNQRRPMQPQPNFAQAEALLKDVIGDQRHRSGAEHRATQECSNLLADLYIRQEKYKEAEDLLTALLPDRVVSKFVKRGRRAVEENPTIPASMSLLADVYRNQGKSAAADSLMKNYTKIMQTMTGSELPSTRNEESLATLLSLGTRAMDYAQQRRPPAAVELMTKFLEGYRRLAIDRDPARARLDSLLIAIQAFVGNLPVDPNSYRMGGPYGPVKRLLQEVADIDPTQGDENEATASGSYALAAISGEDNLATMTNMGALGDTYAQRGDYEKAEEVYGELWGIQRKALGENHQDTRRTLSKLAWAYLDDSTSHQAKGNSDQAQRKSEKGEELLNQLLKLSLSVSGEEEQINSRDIRHRLADLFVSQGRYDKAEEQFEAILAIQRRILGGSDIPVFRIMVNQTGWTRLRQQKFAEAESGLRELMPFFDGTKPEALPYYRWESNLGISLVGQRKYEEAEPRLLQGYDGIGRTEPNAPPRAKNDPEHFTLDEVGEWIVRLYQEWGKPDKAAEWRAKIQADKASAPSPRR